MSKRNLCIIGWVLSIIIVIIVMLYEGRLPTSASWNIMFWVSDTFSGENSQQMFDPYSFSHFQHGLFFFFFFSFLWSNLLKKKFHYYELFLLAIIAEWLREVAENSQYIINLYRSNTAALGYEGDTILNSVFDIISCLIGAIVAHRIRFKKSVILFFIIEITMILILKDSLLLNVIMLVYPLESIKEFQLWESGV